MKLMSAAVAVQQLPQLLTVVAAANSSTVVSDIAGWCQWCDVIC